MGSEKHSEFWLLALSRSTARKAVNWSPSRETGRGPQAPASEFTLGFFKGNASWGLLLLLFQRASQCDCSLAEGSMSFCRSAHLGWNNSVAIKESAISSTLWERDKSVLSCPLSTGVFLLDLPGPQRLWMVCWSLTLAGNTHEWARENPPSELSYISYQLGWKPGTDKTEEEQYFI